MHKVQLFGEDHKNLRNLPVTILPNKQLLQLNKRPNAGRRAAVGTKYAITAAISWKISNVLLQYFNIILIEQRRRYGKLQDKRPVHRSKCDHYCHLSDFYWVSKDCCNVSNHAFAKAIDNWCQISNLFGISKGSCNASDHSAAKNKRPCFQIKATLSEVYAMNFSVQANILLLKIAFQQP